MQHLYLKTLKEALTAYQGKRRAASKDRNERNTFNAIRWFSTEFFEYGDDCTVQKFINRSTSRVKFGVDELVAMCVEMEDISTIEDLLIEVKEEIELKREKRKEQLQLELRLL